MKPTESASPRYRLVVADDHAGFLEEVCRLLAADFEVVAAVKDGVAVIHAVSTLRPDAVVCDISMPGLDGIESGARILRQGLCNAVVVLTMHSASHMVEKALQQGIRGYILKVDAGEELVPAVHTVVRGGQYLSQGVAH